MLATSQPAQVTRQDITASQLVVNTCTLSDAFKNLQIDDPKHLHLCAPTVRIFAAAISDADEQDAAAMASLQSLQQPSISKLAVNNPHVGRTAERNAPMLDTDFLESMVERTTEDTHHLRFMSSREHPHPSSAYPTKPREETSMEVELTLTPPTLATGEGTTRSLHLVDRVRRSRREIRFGMPYTKDKEKRKARRELKKMIGQDYTIQWLRDMRELAQSIEPEPGRSAEPVYIPPLAVLKEPGA